MNCHKSVLLILFPSETSPSLPCKICNQKLIACFAIQSVCRNDHYTIILNGGNRGIKLENIPLEVLDSSTFNGKSVQIQFSPFVAVSPPKRKAAFWRLFYSLWAAYLEDMQPILHIDEKTYISTFRGDLSTYFCNTAAAVRKYSDQFYPESPHSHVPSAEHPGIPEQ